MSPKPLNWTSTDADGSHQSVVTIADVKDIHHVYLSRNAAPRSVAEAIVRTLNFGWLSRFEASEWTTAFIAAAKPFSHLLSCDRPSPFGLVRLTRDWRDHNDLSFRYLVTTRKQALWIIALSREDADAGEYSALFEGTLDGFCAFANVDPECVRLMTLPSRHTNELGAAEPPGSLDPPLDSPSQVEVMRPDEPGDALLPITVDDLADLLEGIDLQAEVRIALLSARPTQMRVAGIRTSFAAIPPQNWSAARIVWIVAGEHLGEIPLDRPTAPEDEIR